MFRKTGVPIMGVVENMSYVEDPSGKRVYLFGKEGGKKFAEAAGLPLLAEIPVYAEISAGGDSGTPVATQKDHPAAALFLRLAEGIAEKLALKKAQP
jgi:ATP-binding protein involved in chromosome partitioning